MEPAPGPHEAAPPTPSAVKPEPPRPRHATSWALIRRIAGVYLRPYIPPLRWAVACMAVAALMTGALAWLMEPVLDDVLGDKRTDLIWPVASAVFVTFALRGAASYGQVVLTNRIGQAVVADIQRDLFTRLLTLDLAFFHAHPTGTLMSSVTNDVSVMRTAVTDTLGLEALPGRAGHLPLRGDIRGHLEPPPARRVQVHPGADGRPCGLLVRGVRRRAAGQGLWHGSARAGPGRSGY